MFILSTTARPDQCVVSSINRHWEPITHSSLQYFVRTLITYWEYMALLPRNQVRDSALNPKLICALINGINVKPQKIKYASISLVLIFLKLNNLILGYFFHTI